MTIRNTSELSINQMNVSNANILSAWELTSVSFSNIQHVEFRNISLTGSSGIANIKHVLSLNISNSNFIDLVAEKYPGLILENVTATLKGIQFKTLTSKIVPEISTDIGSAIILKGNVNMNLKHSILERNSIAMTITNVATFNLLNCSFIANIYGGISIINSAGNPSTIVQSKFYDTSNTKTLGSSISMLSMNTPLTIINSEFKNNQALQGGSIYITETSEVNLQNCSFINNRATHETKGTGGAIMVESINTLNIDDSHFDSNYALLSGGAIAINRAIISNSFLRYSGAKLVQSTFVNNSANYGGALYVDTEFILHILSSRFIKNKALLQGGAIQASGSSIATNTSNYGSPSNLSYSEIFKLKTTFGFLIDGSLFQENSANDGGALNLFSTHLSISIQRTTFKLNTAENQGGSVSMMVYSIWMNGLVVEQSTSNVGSCLNVLTVVDDEVGLRIQNSKFDSCHSKESGGINIGENIMATIENSNFSNSLAQEYGGSIMTYSPITLNSVLFSNNSAYYGGSISVHDNGILYMQDSICSHSTAEYGGCAYVVSSNHNVRAINSSFIDNRASFGGCLSFGAIENNPHNVQQLHLESSQFSCHSHVGGGSLFFRDTVVDQNSFSFVHSNFNSTTSGYAPQLGSDPIDFRFKGIKKLQLKKVLNSQETQLTAWNSTLFLPIFAGEEFNIAIQPIDAFSNDIILHPAYTCSISVPSTYSNVLNGHALNLPISNNIEFTNLILFGNKGDVSQVRLELKGENGYFLDYRINIIFNGCPAGFINEDDMCIQCPQGSYSIVPDATSCQIKCNNFDCLGGSEISYQKGFWVSVDDDGIVTALPCPNAKCFGGNFKFVSEGGTKLDNSIINRFSTVRRSLSNETMSAILTNISSDSSRIFPEYQGSLCIGNREGIVCGACLPGYSEWNGNCVRCTGTNPLKVILLIGYYLGLITFIWLTSQSNSHASSTFKIIISFCQTTLEVIKFSSWAIAQSSSTAIVLAVLTTLLESIVTLSIPSTSSISIDVVDRSSSKNVTGYSFDSCPFDRPGYWYHSSQLLTYLLLFTIAIFSIIIATCIHTICYRLRIPKQKNSISKSHDKLNTATSAPDENDDSIADILDTDSDLEEEFKDEMDIDKVANITYVTKIEKPMFHKSNSLDTIDSGFLSKPKTNQVLPVSGPRSTLLSRITLPSYVENTKAAKNVQSLQLKMIDNVSLISKREIVQSMTGHKSDHSITYQEIKKSDNKVNLILERLGSTIYNFISTLFYPHAFTRALCNMMLFTYQPLCLIVLRFMVGCANTSGTDW
eukprot:CAMPEP_0117419140 /NCGR_PEP_ID=MMETSP0758-20121206/775_1 /TAXON_ID=63605 /ORGANISM="Percolomonas cosmopolitus, Strain AE-1 (ATCC 50343)" /LENGTH=1290 /DNA_ID=CAMNT_0005200053 /DNA_START=3606 /DNA_END=7475 /DNA_ORIENTATION=+